MQVIVWPDGFWCEPGELEQCQAGRSDDFRRVTIPEWVTDIDRYLQVTDYMARPMPEWELKAQIPGCHKIFLDKISGRHSICDYSGRLPHQTDDGILWIDTTLPLINSEGKWGVPLLNEKNDHSSTLATAEEAAWLIENLKMEVKIGEYLFYPYKQIPMIPRKDGVGDVSTKHITAEDSMKLQGEVVPRQIGKFEYGYVVLTHPRRETRMTAAIKDAGMSDAYVHLLNVANDLGYHYLMIDQDGPEIEGLQTFDW